MRTKITSNYTEKNGIRISIARDYVVFDQKTGEELGFFGLLTEKYTNTSLTSITLSFFKVSKPHRGKGFAKLIASEVNFAIDKLSLSENALCLLIEPCPYEDSGLSEEVLRTIYPKYFNVNNIFGSRNFLVKSFNENLTADEAFELIVNSEYSNSSAV